MEERLAEIKASLRTIPLFQPLSEDELTELSSHVKIEAQEPGNVLFHQGDPGDSFYIVQTGEVEITIRPQGSNPLKKIRKIVDAGGSFGEMSLLTGANRAGDAKILSQAELLVIEKAPFRELLLANDSVAAELGATMLRLLASNKTIEHSAPNADAASDGDAQTPSVIINDTEDTLLRKIRSFFGL